jgi:hypothetical protein
VSTEPAGGIEERVRVIQRGEDAEVSAGLLYDQYSGPIHRFFRRRGFAPDAAHNLTRESLVRVGISV